MRLPLKIAIRFLKSNKGQTALIAIGIAIGVSVQVFIGSLIFGLQKSLVNSTIGNSPQITITSKDDSVLFRGLDLINSDKIYNINDRLVDGFMPSSNNEVLIGTSLQEELKINLNDIVNITTTKGDNSEVKVVGIFDLKVASLNKSWLISNLNTDQNIFNLENKITSIEMQVPENEAFNVQSIATNINTSLNDSTLVVDNWMDQNEQLLSGLNGQSVSSYMIQFFVIVSVVLGIASVLAISVVQRSKQIGILKAMGIKDKDASLIFLYQGIILGILGAILGIILGLGLMFSFSKFALNPDGTPVVALLIDYKFIAISALIAILASTIAAFIPARRSSKLDPMEVIKNG
ncbi:MAG: ABC transporter permease [Clostridiaceae bacterium]